MKADNQFVQPQKLENINFNGYWLVNIKIKSTLVTVYGWKMNLYVTHQNVIIIIISTEHFLYCVTYSHAFYYFEYNSSSLSDFSYPF